MKRQIIKIIFLTWYSKLIAEKYDSTGPDQKTRGRKPITDDLKALILRLAE